MNILKIPLIRVYKDTCCIGAKGNKPWINKIDTLYEQRKIYICIAKLLLNELEKGKSYIKGRAKALQYVYDYEPKTINRNTIGNYSNEYYKCFNDLLTMVFGRKNKNQYSDNQIDDVRLLNIAIYNGGHYFITYDKSLLDKTQEIEKKYRLKVKTPESCFKEAEILIEKEKQYSIN